MRKLALKPQQRDLIREAWAAESIRRRDEVRSGKVKTVPGEQVLAEVRRLAGR